MPLSPLIYAPPAARAANSQSLYEFTPGEEEDFLSQLSGGAGSVLGTIGSVIDAPASVVRNTIGMFTGAADNPFQGLFNYEDRTSGRDLAESMGFLEDNTPGLDFGDVLGVGIETVLDPWTWLTLGGSAVTKSAQVLKNAGFLDDFLKVANRELAEGATTTGKRVKGMQSTFADVFEELLAGGTKESQVAIRETVETAAKGLGTTVDELIQSREPLSGLVGVGPFAAFGKPSQVLGTGEVPQKIAGVMDKVGSAVRYSRPVREGAALFDKASMGARSVAGQIAAPFIDDATVRAGIEADTYYAKQVSAFHDLGALDPELNLAEPIQEFLEIGKWPKKLPDNVKEFIANKPEIEPVLREISDRYDFLYDMQKDAGTIISKNDDEYMTRFATRYSDGVFGKKGRLVYKTIGPQATKRQEYLKDIPGRTMAINQMSLDPRIAGKNATKTGKEATDYVLETYGLGTEEHLSKKVNRMMRENGLDFQSEKDIAKATRLAKSAVNKQARQLVKRMGRRTEEQLAKGTPMFPNHPLENLRQYETFARQRVEAAKGLWDFLGRNIEGLGKTSVRIEEGVVVDAVEELADGMGVDLASIAYKARMDPDVGIKTLASGLKMDDKSFLRDVAGASEEDILAWANRETKGGAILKNITVPAEIADDATRFMKAFQAPEEVEGLVRLIDNFNSVFRAHVTMPFLAFAVRNLYSGQWMNHVGGLFGFQSVMDAERLMTGKISKGIRAQIPEFKALGMTDKQSMRRLGEYAFSNQLGGRRSALGRADLPGELTGTISDSIPGLVPFERKALYNPMLNLPKSWKPTPKNFWKGLTSVPGVREGESNFAAKWGERAAEYVEGLNRMGAMIEGLKQGMDIKEVRRKVLALQADYSNMSAFEKSTMKRLVPFYSFTRRMVPTVLKEYAERPGGWIGAATRAGNVAKSDAGFVPEYIDRGLGVSLGKDEESGMTQFLTQVDLPHEILNSLFVPGSTPLKTIENTGMSLLGQTNPLLKGASELATNKQFYSGRDLSSLKSKLGLMVGAQQVPGGIRVLEQILMNSPLSRMVSFTGQITSSKPAWAKALNATTGVRITDADIDKKKNFAAIDTMREFAREDSDFYVGEFMTMPKSKMATATPAQLKMIQLQRNLNKRRREAKNPREIPNVFMPWGG